MTVVVLQGCQHVIGMQRWLGEGVREGLVNFLKSYGK